MFYTCEIVCGHVHNYKSKQMLRITYLEKRKSIMFLNQITTIMSSYIQIMRNTYIPPNQCSPNCGPSTIYIKITCVLVKL